MSVLLQYRSHTTFRRPVSGSCVKIFLLVMRRCFVLVIHSETASLYEANTYTKFGISTGLFHIIIVLLVK